MATRVLHVVGTRPNFMKISPIMQVMKKYPREFVQALVHTGQHYDPLLSDIFFFDLEMPRPDFNLDVGSGSHAWQTAQIMLRFEHVMRDFNPDLVVVPGDVNSTLACALVAAKQGIRIAHVEAGLRSFDRSMPEEINRVLTDHLADFLFTTESSGNQNLSSEGVPSSRIFFVGNTMIDTLSQLLPKAKSRLSSLKQALDLERFILLTLHRPVNVDDPGRLAELICVINKISRVIPVVFPMHPRTRKRLEGPVLTEDKGYIRWHEPFGYLDFLALEHMAALVITDSGGIQEETTYMGVPCVTIRPNTERPSTIVHGTNHLFNESLSRLPRFVDLILRAPQESELGRHCPELWDGLASERIVEIMRRE
jgi:UDP-N-acetylglucosamine 2-epimerase (non-hydrolysing)